MGSPWPFLSRIRYPAVSSTRSYIVNLASPPIFIPHPNQHTNRISLSYTLAYAIYCGQMMHIWRLRFTLIWTIVRQSLCKKWTRLACGRGFAGFWFELGTDFYVAFVPDSQRSCMRLLWGQSDSFDGSCEFVRRTRRCPFRNLPQSPNVYTWNWPFCGDGQTSFWRHFPRSARKAKKRSSTMTNLLTRRLK